MLLPVTYGLRRDGARYVQSKQHRKFRFCHCTVLPIRYADTDREMDNGIVCVTKKSPPV